MLPIETDNAVNQWVHETQTIFIDTPGYENIK